MSPILVAFAAILLAYLLRSWLNRPSVKHVKGPPPVSFWLGHERVLRSQGNIGELEMKWCKEYGTVYRVGGCFGQDVLVVSDPKALDHIFHTSHPYPKSQDFNFILGLMLGGGLIVVDAEIHHRQRKIINPAFSRAQLRNSQLIFQQCSDKLVEALKGSLPGPNETVNIVEWTSNVTLDIIGLAAFRYDFGSLEGRNTELGQAMRHLFTTSQSNTTAFEFMFVALIRMLPESVLKLLRLISTRETRQFARVREVSRKAAREIMISQYEVQEQGEDKDIVDLLGRACLTGKMNADEIESQLITFVLAGHETTGTTVAWLLYELAIHPDHQSIIREELKQFKDYDSMPFMNAAIKEVLRFHPIVHSLTRTAPHDDVLPLSGGKTLAVPKGQTFACSMYAYNRLSSLWGDDAEEWNPARFLKKGLPVSLGVYANLMTFGAGPRSCIGWRFALMELQTILARLIQNFEFSLPEGGVEIVQFPGSPAVVPVVKGKAHLGARVPLRVKVLHL
ncbi:cytochrome P450 [Guyanagaster necrorhizus]|uniref:Cytochrome P450 n=1 Tax=Guyanagaster necrorhizus TaxID=856835 RepID=A0A9P7VGG6_9AGAR|nr:cytochrome P450 [Guyanagaster necrorhizus MCA 3950]KAG7440274.1 cytochrome P450 [Guyanagaster necrorhizus MCA 3950]